MKTKKVMIVIDNWTRVDYPDLTKKKYKGILLGYCRKESEEGDTAYYVRLNGEKTKRIFFNNELINIKFFRRKK